MTSPERIEVRGIRELSRALKGISDDAPKEIQFALKAAAEEIATKVRAKVPSRSGRARGSVKVRASKTGAALAVGGNAAPHYQWLDFGGSSKIDASSNTRATLKKSHRKLEMQGNSRPRAYREFIKGGRYLYPTISEARDSTLRKVDHELGVIARRHGIETRGRAA